MDLVSLFGVSGRVALVTGGSRGIGLMIAEGLVSNGAKVYITSRDEKACKKSEQKLNLLAKQGGSAVAFTSDLSTEKGCIEAVEFIKARESKLHILINNSGTNWGEALDKYPIDAFDKLFRLNLFGYFSLVQKLLPLLEAGASSEWSANVINIGSVMGISVPKLEVYAYATSKAAVHHLTKILAPKLAEKNITCNAFAPGPFPSKMMKHTLEKAGPEIVEGIPLNRIGSPQDIAAATLWLCGKGGSYVTGTIIPIDGGYLVSPRM